MQLAAPIRKVLSGFTMQGSSCFGLAYSAHLRSVIGFPSAVSFRAAKKFKEALLIACRNLSGWCGYLEDHRYLLSSLIDGDNWLPYVLHEVSTSLLSPLTLSPKPQTLHKYHSFHFLFYQTLPVDEDCTSNLCWPANTATALKV